MFVELKFSKNLGLMRICFPMYRIPDAQFFSFLLDCTSYRELTDNLQYILIAIQEKELQPLVLFTN